MGEKLCCTSGCPLDLTLGHELTRGPVHSYGVLHAGHGLYELTELGLVKAGGRTQPGWARTEGPAAQRDTAA